MNRQEKALVVEQLRKGFLESQAVFVVSCQGLTVASAQLLRKELRKHNGSFKVAKARLMKRALAGVDTAIQFEPYLKNQIGLVFAEKESPVIAKALHDFSKENQSLKLLVGQLDSVFLDNKAVIRVASLPSREILLAMVVGTLQAPLRSLMSIVDQLKAGKE